MCIYCGTTLILIYRYVNNAQILKMRDAFKWQDSLAQTVRFTTLRKKIIFFILKIDNFPC